MIMKWQIKQYIHATKFRKHRLFIVRNNFGTSNRQGFRHFRVHRVKTDALCKLLNPINDEKKMNCVTISIVILNMCFTIVTRLSVIKRNGFEYGEVEMNPSFLDFLEQFQCGKIIRVAIKELVWKNLYIS